MCRQCRTSHYRRCSSVPLRERAMRLQLLTVLALAAPVAAHDLWIEPATFSPEAGQILPVRLRVGQGLLGDPVPRMTSLIRDFIVEDAGGRKPLVGRDGSDPAGFLRVAAPGLLVIGYAS